YLTRVTPDFISTMAETVSDYQVDALRDAVVKHISFATSLRVHMPSGYPTFWLEFHLPYLELREVDGESMTCMSRTNHETGTVLSDVSFLNIMSTQGSLSRYCLQRAHISVMICGSDNVQWVGYAFANNTVDEDGTENEEDEIEGSVDTDFAEDEDEGEVDLFASDDSDEVLDANIPIYDPREYWLRVVKLRLRLIVSKWEYLVYKVEKSVENQERRHGLILSRGPQSHDPGHMEKLLHWNMQTVHLLNELHGYLRPALRAWSRFSSPSGDKGFFSDITDSKATRTMHLIKESFEILSDLEHRLVLLDRSSKLSARTLNLESNRLNTESYDLNRQAHVVHLSTSVISRDIQHLNRRSTEAACENQKAAQETSQTTRVSVEILLFTTPFAIALQYFGAERAIFSFNRNPRSFFICIVILLIALRFFVAIIAHPEHVAKFLRRRLHRRGWRRNVSGDFEGKI
ncbi:hypothetical protein CC86DRAFT_280201, partial [Ophiobolus disseminans]